MFFQPLVLETNSLHSVLNCSNFPLNKNMTTLFIYFPACLFIHSFLSVFPLFSPCVFAECATSFPGVALRCSLSASHVHVRSSRSLTFPPVAEKQLVRLAGWLWGKSALLKGTGGLDEGFLKESEKSGGISAAARDESKPLSYEKED